MNRSMLSTPLDTVMTYHRAWTSGDVDTAFTLVAPGITCRAPGKDLVGIDAYRRYIADFARTLTGIGDIATFTDDNRVVLLYYPQTAVTATTPAAECFTVRDGMITESLLIFDRLSYVPDGTSDGPGERP